MIKSKRGFALSRHPELDSGSCCSTHQSGEIPNRVWNDNCFGFTLIELLVGILIIGILAAVALPQYQRAVLKSRYSAMMPAAKALAESNEVYYMEHGTYSEDPTELVVQGKAEYPDGTNILMYDEDGLSYVRATNDSVPNARYLVYQKHSENFAGTTMCEAGDERANALCVALGGQVVEGGNSNGEADWTAYLLSGNYGSTDTFAGSGEGENDEGNDTTSEPQTPTCSEADKPADVTASNSGATGTATCVNGQWKYQWTGGTVYEDSTICTATTENACAGSTFSGQYAQCIGDATNGCSDSTFSGQNYSRCYGNISNGCADSTFSGEGSHCYGRAANGCAGSTFSGEQVHCFATVANGCTGTTILAGAYCVPYGSASGCDGAKYGVDPTGTRQGMGSCMDIYGNCPTGVPLRGDWNSTNGSYDITGWKGNCCNPAYMVSGECPADIAVCG